MYMCRPYLGMLLHSKGVTLDYIAILGL